MIKVGGYVRVEMTGDCGRVEERDVFDDGSSCGIDTVGVRLDSGRLTWVPESEVTLDERYAQPA